MGFDHLNLRTNLRVLIQLQNIHPIDVRHRDLVAQDMLPVENTQVHSIAPAEPHSCLQLSLSNSRLQEQQ